MMSAETNGDETEKEAGREKMEDPEEDPKEEEEDPKEEEEEEEEEDWGWKGPCPTRARPLI